MNDQKEETCTCGRRIATERENKAAHDAKKCAFCYDFELWTKTFNKPAIRTENKK